MSKVINVAETTMMAKVRNYIYNMHLTWEEIADIFGVSVGYLRYHKVKPYYKVRLKYYEKLCKAERLNKKSKANTSSIISVDVQPTPIKEVLIIETGSVIDLGLKGILEYGMDTYISEFCLRELSRISESANAEEFLAFYKDAKINSINMRNQEVLYVDPTDDVKNRSVGVVALAVYMHAAGYKVRLVTNSREIERLAILQGCDIDVTRIKKVW